MSATIDTALTDRITALQQEIAVTEAARPPIEAEVASATAALDVLAVRAGPSCGQLVAADIAAGHGHWNR